MFKSTHSELGRDGSGQIADPLSLLERDECRHGSDLALLRDFLVVSVAQDIAYLLCVNVNLDKDDTRVLVLHFGEVRANHLAWAAPGCPEVDDDRLITLNLEISGHCDCTTAALTRVLNSSNDETSLTIVLVWS